MPVPATIPLTSTPTLNAATVNPGGTTTLGGVCARPRETAVKKQRTNAKACADDRRMAPSALVPGRMVPLDDFILGLLSRHCFCQDSYDSTLSLSAGRPGHNTKRVQKSRRLRRGQPYSAEKSSKTEPGTPARSFSRAR